LRLLENTRRGQATILGGVLFLLIAMLLTGYLFELFTVQREMNQQDLESTRERLEITDVFFGSKAEYTSPNSTTITTGTGTFDTSENADPYANINSTFTYGITDPLGNGDFQRNADGWYFSYSYIDATHGASGAYSTEPTGSQTGPGAIYMDFYYDPSPSSFSYATLNWSAPIYFDLDAIDELAIENVTLSYGFFTSIADPGKISDATLSVFVVNSTGSEYSIPSIDVDDESLAWEEPSNIDISDAVSGSDWYTLKFSVYVKLKKSGSGRPEHRLFLDDIEVNVHFQNHVLDWEYVYTLNQDPTDISELEMSFTGHYNKSIIQALSVIDQTNDRHVLLSQATISEADVKLTFPISGTDIQRYIDQETNNITFRVYAVSSDAFQNIAATPTLDVSYTGTRDTILIPIQNTGGVPVSVTSIWINDYTGHTQYEVDFQIGPGQTYIYEASHAWTPGEYMIKAITTKGSMTVTTVTAT